MTGEIDRSTTNEIQSLIISGNDLSISSGNSINLSFLSSTLWQQSGSDIYYTSGNVGIGVSNPQYTLDIVGTINQTTTLSDGRTTNIQAGENVA
ncbi:MAG: hypothetical protein H6766_07310 [Candidatus Peribacteria bacterium]|nr:MAG: hypothetical protein H6766_07310 [Candidatus Peribacteria bacterium]